MAELVHLLVPDSELARWREEAHDRGLSLTKLIRERMKGDRSSDAPLHGDSTRSDPARDIRDRP